MTFGIKNSVDTNKSEETKNAVKVLLESSKNAIDLVQAREKALEESIEIEKEKMKTLVAFIIDNKDDLGVDEFKGEYLNQFLIKNDRRLVSGIIAVNSSHNKGQIISGRVTKYIMDFDNGDCRGIYHPHLEKDKECLVRFNLPANDSEEAIYVPPHELAKKLERLKYKDLDEKLKEEFGIKA
jgi:hypothetical protein